MLHQVLPHLLPGRCYPRLRSDCGGDASPAPPHPGHASSIPYYCCFYCCVHRRLGPGARHHPQPHLRPRCPRQWPRRSSKPLARGCRASPASSRACRLASTGGSAAMLAVLPQLDVPPDVRTFGCTSCLHLRRQVRRQLFFRSDHLTGDRGGHPSKRALDFSSSRAPVVTSYVTQESSGLHRQEQPSMYSKRSDYFA